MDKQQQTLQIILSGGMLPLYFHPSPQVSGEVLRALYAGGVRVVEYTNRGKEALDNFKALKQIGHATLPGMHIGIGTIRSREAAKQFIDAGADFLISPGVVDEVIQTAKEHNLLCLPGCMTPTEMLHAERLGMNAVKLFPGNVLGPAFVSAVRELFPGMVFMPTGGVDTSAENIRQWFAAGVSAVGMGSKLLSREVLEQGDYAAITARTREVLNTIASIRKAQRPAE